MAEYWYKYKYRGFSLGCQPKDFADWSNDEGAGRFGAVAYNRELSTEEINEYELEPWKIIEAKEVSENDYEVQESFIHFDSQEVMYRVKITYPSGGIKYTVLNEEQLKNIENLNL